MSVARWQNPRLRSSPDSLVQFDNCRPMPGDDEQAEVGSLAVGIALDPIMVGNEVTLNAENCHNARIAGVVFEKHFHFGSTSSSLSESSRDIFRSSASSSRCAFASLAAHYIRQYSWICPLDSGPRYAVEDLYVGLKMKLLDRNGRMKHGDARKKKILFEPFNRTNVTPRTVLVIGGPGFGKTTLCRKMAYDWAGQGKTFPEFSIDEAVVLYLDMSCLSKNANLEEELLKLAMQDENMEPDNVALSETAETLKSYDRNVIVVLDGYVDICEELRVQIRELTKFRRNSAFKAASVVVTSRPGLDENTLLLFHKHFILKGFSAGLAQKLMFKYFKRSSSPLGAYYQDVLDRFQMRNLSPLVILALCDCEVKVDSGFNSYDTFRQLAVKLVKHCNTRNNLGLTNKQIEDKLDRLGLFFWKCLCKEKYYFNLRELELGLKDDFEFLATSGLLKTKEGISRWEPVHQVLMDSIAMSHLEKRWLSCRTSEDVHSFLTSFFPKVPSLKVCCCTSKNGYARFRITFDYLKFTICFIISEDESKFFLLNSSSDLTVDNSDDGLSISYHYLLRNKEDSITITHNLMRMYRNQKHTLCSVAQFILASQFEELQLRFSFPFSSFTQNFFSKIIKDCVVPDQTFPHPLSYFRTFCQDLHVTFLKSACNSLFVTSVLECLLSIENNSLRFHSEYHIVEGLRTTTVKPPFVAAHIYGSKTMYSRSRYASVRPATHLQAFCDRLQFIFRTNETLETTTDVTLL